MAVPSKIPESDLPAIIERYRNHEKLLDIAKEYGCSDKALYQRIQIYCDSGKGDSSYHDLVTEAYLIHHQHCVAEYNEAEQMVMNAPDALELTRAREVAAIRERKVKLSQWGLERRRPKLFGQKQQVDVDNRITVIVNKNVHRQGELRTQETQEAVSGLIDITPIPATD